MMIIYLDIMLP